MNEMKQPVFDPSKRYEMTARFDEKPIRDHPKIKQERNKRKRARFVKALKRVGIISFTAQKIEWRELP